MQLSEAIRLGAMNKPQHFGDTEGMADKRRFITQLFGSYETVTERVPGTCAMGAAFEAVNAPRERLAPGVVSGTPFRGAAANPGDTVVVIRHPWMALTNTTATCPLCPVVGLVCRLIPHMNDEHRMTREAIADWVETLEVGATDPAVVASVGTTTG